MKKELLPTLLLFLCCCPNGASAQQSSETAALSRVSGELQRGEYLAAKEHARAQLRRRPKDVRFLTLEAIANAGLRRPAEAQTNYATALTIDKTYLPALEGSAQLAFQQGTANAGQLLQRVLAIRPSDETAHALLGELAFRASECSTALEHFMAVRNHAASEPTLMQEKAICLSRTGRNDEAIPLFANLVSRFPDLTEVRFDLAVSQANANRLNEAIDTLTPLLATDLQDEESALLMVELLDKQAKTQDALNLLRALLLQCPTCTRGFLEYAQLSYAHSSAAIGLDVLNVGIDRNPREPKLFLARGLLRTQLRDFDGAEEDFDAASRLDPNVEFVDDVKGLVDAQRHSESKAISSYRRAVATHPEDGYAHYLLAEALRRTGPDPGTEVFKEEMSAAIEAARLDPGSSQVHDLLSQIDLRAGKQGEALAEVQMAVRLDQENQQALYHLILQLRREEVSDDLPKLLQRLAELRAKGDQRDPAQSRYRLVEVK